MFGRHAGGRLRDPVQAPDQRAGAEEVPGRRVHHGSLLRAGRSLLRYDVITVDVIRNIIQIDYSITYEVSLWRRSQITHSKTFRSPTGVVPSG